MAVSQHAIFLHHPAGWFSTVRSWILLCGSSGGQV